MSENILLSQRPKSYMQLTQKLVELLKHRGIKDKAKEYNKKEKPANNIDQSYTEAVENIQLLVDLLCNKDVFNITTNDETKKVILDFLNNYLPSNKEKIGVLHQQEKSIGIPSNEESIERLQYRLIGMVKKITDFLNTYKIPNDKLTDFANSEELIVDQNSNLEDLENLYNNNYSSLPKDYLQNHKTGECILVPNLYTTLKVPHLILIANNIQQKTFKQKNIEKNESNLTDQDILLLQEFVSTLEKLIKNGYIVGINGYNASKDTLHAQIIGSQNFSINPFILEKSKNNNFSLIEGICELARNNQQNIPSSLITCLIDNEVRAIVLKHNFLNQKTDSNILESNLNNEQIIDILDKMILGPACIETLVEKVGVEKPKPAITKLFTEIFGLKLAQKYLKNTNNSNLNSKNDNLIKCIEEKISNIIEKVKKIGYNDYFLEKYDDYFVL